MKSMMKILTRYLASAAGVALLLLILNFAVLAVWMAQVSKNQQTKYSVSEIADSLTKQNGVYVLSQDGQDAIKSRYQWAMLLDDSGTVVWSKNLPGDVPRSYTVSEAAGFSRWYLKDYPVYVWRRPDGLLVLGSAKGGTWKLGIELPQKVMDDTLIWIPFVLVLNGIAAALLAMLLGLRLVRSLRPIAQGIEDMAHKKPVALPAGGILGDLAAELNQTSAELQRQEEALQRRDNARTAWIAGVSHDIRTPLSIVMGYATRLEDNPQLPQTEREQASVILRQSEKIRTLVQDLNLASKLEYDMQPLRPTSLFPAALVRETVADFLNSGLDTRYSIDVKVEKEAQSAVVRGDEALLRRAVSNLISNSIRHNPEGCTVTVTVEKNASYCRISVSDDGIGFPQEILEAFQNPERTIELRSHSLGITIVRQIIRAHGGMAEFRNLEGGGCLAVLNLPVPADAVKE
jgi:Signal transduction histidine kinase